jgi:hypothetical protein
MITGTHAMDILALVTLALVTWAMAREVRALYRENGLGEAIGFALGCILRLGG